MALTRPRTSDADRGPDPGAAPPDPADADAAVFAGPGEMAARCRAFDWAATPLGPVARWSRGLRTTVATVLASRHPMFLFWGPAHVQVYNDAYRPSLGRGERADRALGALGPAFWTDIWDAIGPEIAQVLAGGPATWHEDQHLPIERDGRLDDVWWTYSYSAVRDDDGRIAGVLVVCQETTAGVRGRAEREALIAAERDARAEAERERRRLAGVLDAITDAHFTMDPAFRLQSLNAAMVRSLGAPAAGFLGRTHWDAFPGSVGTPADAHYRRAMAERTEVHFTQAYVDAVYDRIVEVDAYPAEDGGLAVFWREVTARVHAAAERDRLLAESERARAALEHARVRAEAVLASIADAFYLLDRDWRFAYVNAAAEPLLRTTGAALLGRTVWEAFPGLVGSAFEGPYREAMAAGRVTSAEAYFAPLGTWFDVRTYPWAGGLMVHFRDVGARKAAEAERERLLAAAEAARREAEGANQAKSEFLAVMSHELRTPLNAIGGYAELIELGIRGPVTPEQRADLEKIQRSQRHLLGLINGVLNYARVEAGAVHYAVEDVPLDEVLATCEALVAPQVRARGLTLRHDGCDRALRVRADREKLQQVVLNLLSNAVKFTESGGRVALRCAVAPGAAPAAAPVRIVVADTGIGIAADQLARVFEPFVQVDARLTRTQEGTGLGLAISRDLARGMGGDLTAESTPGVGSTFTLTLPAA